MELKATTIGKHLARHPYHSVEMLPAGIAMRGDEHEYIIPFNELVSFSCRRGVVWGEFEFLLADNKIVRLHGTEWQDTRDFYRQLKTIWQAWSSQMAAVTLQVLQQLELELIAPCTKGWFSYNDLNQLQQLIKQSLAALPLPEARLKEFPECTNLWKSAKLWLDEGEAGRTELNQQWAEQQVVAHQDFFASTASTPLNTAQILAVINGEQYILVLAGAGCGKTSVLVARCAWLIQKIQVKPSQILLLAFGKEAATELNQRVNTRLGDETIFAVTFHELARRIIQESTNKTTKISELETNQSLRQSLLITSWQQQCVSKKSAAAQWRTWLSEALTITIPDNDFWNDKQIIDRLTPKLERWIVLMRMRGGTVKTLLELADDTLRPQFNSHLKLMAPLLKVWKSYLKQEGSLDFSGLIEQACELLVKGRFISPWKHILVDEFQDISPQRMQLIDLLRKQNEGVHLFTVGDDWQAISRFSGCDVSMTTQFKQRYPGGAICYLDQTYRYNQRIGAVSSDFVQANPLQLAKMLNSQSPGGKKAIQFLSEEKLEALINKMSGYVSAEQRIFILGRYHYSQPEILANAATRWPNLTLKFQTIHASKGQEADYVIILGLSNSSEGIAVHENEGIFEQVLLPRIDRFEYAEERRLLYVAMTRAKNEVWLMYNHLQPSVFVEELKQLGVRKVNHP